MNKTEMFGISVFTADVIYCLEIFSGTRKAKQNADNISGLFCALLTVSYIATLLSTELLNKKRVNDINVIWEMHMHIFTLQKHI